MLDKHSIDGIDHFLSYREKKSDDFRWAKEAHWFYDMNMNKSQEEVKRNILKASLSAGEMPNLNNADLGRLGIKMYGHAAKREFNLIPHFPLIDQVYEKMRGIRQRMNFEPTAIDMSLFSKNEKTREHLLQLQDMLQQTVFKVYEEKVTREYLMQFGVSDVSQFSHQDQQDMQSQIKQRAQELTPERINEYFDKEYYSPFSEMAQMLLDYESSTKNLKDHFERRFDEGYKFNNEVSYMYESHGIPRIDMCKSEWFDWVGSSDCDRFEMGDRAKYVAYRSPMDTFSRYGEKIKDSDIDKIKAGMYYIGHNGNINVLSGVQETLAIGHYADHEKEYSDINQRTEEGQARMQALQARFFNNRNHGGYLYRDCHVVWKSPITMKSVKRLVNGRIEYSWRENEYEENPDVDIKVKKIKSVMVWQARSLGDPASKIYVDAGPLGYDWSDISDPTRRYLPYSGGYLGAVIENDFNTVRRGLFDKGINHQVKINIEAGRLEEEKGFNIGKVFVMLNSAIGDQSPEQFFDTMKGSKLISLDETQLNNVFASQLATSGRVFTSVDMSNNLAIKDSLEQIEVFYRNLKRSMGADEYDVSPYSTDANLKTSQDNATNATLGHFTTHLKYMNNTLQQYIEFCHYVYKKNPRVLEWVANDMSYQLLLTDDYMTFAKPGIFIRNDIQDQRLLESAKTDMMHFVQNQAYAMIPDYLRMKAARNMTALINAGEGLARKAEQAGQQQQQAQQQQIEQERAAREKEIQDARAHEAGMQKEKLTANLDIAAINSEWAMKQADVDQDGVSDATERDDKDRAYNKERDDKDRALKKEIEMRKAEIAAKTKSVNQKK